MSTLREAAQAVSDAFDDDDLADVRMSRIWALRDALAVPSESDAGLPSVVDITGIDPIVNAILDVDRLADALHSEISHYEGHKNPQTETHRALHLDDARRLAARLREARP